MLKSTCPKHDVHTLQAEKGSADISWGYSDPYGESVLPFLLFRIGLTISVPVLSISHAKLCIRQRKALHPPTQSFASAYAKLCLHLEPHPHVFSLSCNKGWKGQSFLYSINVSYDIISAKIKIINLSRHNVAISRIGM